MFLCSSMPSPASCWHRLALAAGRDTSTLHRSHEAQSSPETCPHSPHPVRTTGSIPGAAETFTTYGERTEVCAVEARQTFYLY